MKHNLLAIFFSVFAVVASFLFSTTTVFAGNDLVVHCPDNATDCSIVPIDTPLFDEGSILPGDSFTQTLTINNFDTDESCDLSMSVTDQTSGQPINIAQKMYGAIYSGSTTYFGAHSSGQVIESQTYQDLYDGGTISLGSLAPSNNLVVTWLAAFSASAGNEYQGVNTTFDFNINITCGTAPSDDPGSSPDPEPSPYVCHEETPATTPVLSLVSSGTNTVSLSWTPVSPVTHYALIFTRDSDGEEYGSANIGNVTSYTVTNLSGGESYTFEIFGVNDCAPGDRSNQISSFVSGPFIEGRPEGPSGEILGDVTDKEKEAEDEAQKQILGESSEVCAEWKLYLPWILLLIQALLTLISEYRYRKDEKKTKHYVAVGITALSIVIFYLLRACQCYGDVSLLTWLCTWYWVVSTALLAILKISSYAFINDD